VKMIGMVVKNGWCEVSWNCKYLSGQWYNI